ncbi:hypothetical protein IM697_06990 [Streptomyces ferrugineus]|uniref:Uncharacterized protein n=1 Tax=Streptomyces ferrugineus TaxID=1413221 RepID=A0A7M2SRM2_9ACTN|nr:hypothetical protein [Streptomyces ferrugineus]QOV38133.1 hypothetical protein IM697_06990 [Streptomyces ferrugineus]
MATPINGTSAALELDLLLHSPDGESRGLFMRVGDVFPLNPIRHILASSDEQASEVRPWGLRFLTIPRPTAGAHEGGSKTTSEGSPDGSGPQQEEMQDD